MLAIRGAAVFLNEREMIKKYVIIDKRKFMLENGKSFLTGFFHRMVNFSVLLRPFLLP